MPVVVRVGRDTKGGSGAKSLSAYVCVCVRSVLVEGLTVPLSLLIFVDNARLVFQMYVYSKAEKQLYSTLQRGVGPLPVLLNSIAESETTCSNPPPLQMRPIPTRGLTYCSALDWLRPLRSIHS